MAQPVRKNQPAKVEENAKDSRIPAFPNEFMVNVATSYLKAVDEISAHNAKYLKPPSDDPNTMSITKLVSVGSKEFSEDPDLKDNLTEISNLQTRLKELREGTAKIVAQKKGVKVSSEPEEAPAEVIESLKAVHKDAQSTARIFGEMADKNFDPDATDLIKEFLAKYPLPTVGRNQTWSAVKTGESATTPKYRVKVSASTVEGETVFTDVSGFSKTIQQIAKMKLHGKGKDSKAPTSDNFREAWEGAGNSMTKTVQNTVSFTHDGIVYTIVKA